MKSVEKRLKKGSAYIQVYSCSDKLIGLIAVKVDGYLFESNGYDFIVHESLKYKCPKCRSIIKPKWFIDSNEWRISEVRTGMVVFYGKTRRDAISKFESHRSLEKLCETLHSKEYKKMIREFEKAKKRKAIDVARLLDL